VRNDDKMRAAHAAVQAQVVGAFMALYQSKPVYRALIALRDTARWQELDPAQRRIVTSAIRVAEQAGVALADEARTRFQAIELELAGLSTRFSNQLLDSSKAFALELRTPDEVAGLPPSLLRAAAHAAAHGGSAYPADPQQGPWRITLDGPSFMPFMEHSRRRDLRERLYRAYIARASSGGTDNLPLVERILSLRREKARLLGFPTFAELSLTCFTSLVAGPGVRAMYCSHPMKTRAPQCSCAACSMVQPAIGEKRMAFLCTLEPRGE
jgi:oligopeptidase A